jgi:predicted nuclease of predicted toxin-antitoxin system
MNLLADESVDGSIVDELRVAGHQVLYVAEMTRGIDDDAVLNQANATGSILLTEDKDFGELVYRLGRVTLGVILIRLAGLASNAKASIVAQAVRQHGAELTGAFSVISPGLLRIRRHIA